jgi:acetyl esterase/lipase
MDYNLLYPPAPQPGMFQENGIFDRGQLRIHWVAYFPAGKGRLPAVLVHGEKDRTAPLAQVQNLCRKMQEAGRRCELFLIPGAGHVFNFLDEEQGKAGGKKHWIS